MDGQNTQRSETAPIVALVGATGRTGKCVLEGALKRGWKVRALARNPDKLEAANDLTVIKGSITDLEAVKELVKGADVVLSCLGTSQGSKSYIVEGGVRMILKAIQLQQPKPRFIHMSSVGLGDSKRQCRKSLWSFLSIYVAFPLIGKGLFADMERAENLILAAKDIESVIVRPAILNNKEGRGYKALTVKDRVGKALISRRDVAAFMLDTVVDRSNDGRAISLFSA